MVETMNEGKDKYVYEYPTVKAWHIHTGSYDYYVKDQIALAQKENAPRNATFKSDGKWHTLKECKDPILANRVRQYARLLINYKEDFEVAQ